MRKVTLLMLLLCVGCSTNRLSLISREVEYGIYLEGRVQKKTLESSRIERIDQAVRKLEWDGDADYESEIVYFFQLNYRKDKRVIYLNDNFEILNLKGGRKDVSVLRCLISHTLLRQ